MSPSSRQSEPFFALGPDAILDSIESVGLTCDGSLLALNSYENRVYRVGLCEGSPVVAKFYRPERWSDEAILEEHEFTLDLAAQEIPVVPPLRIAGKTLFHYGPYCFSLYPLAGGRAPDLENAEHLERLGRFMGRIHALGACRDFAHRPTLDIAHFGDDSYTFLLDHKFLPLELESVYEQLAEDMLDHIEAVFAQIEVRRIRLHGDCHPGNILWTDDGPHIVDFDDARMGPAVQDVWMFLTGEEAHMQTALSAFMDGYSRFHEFDSRQLALIEPLRTLRMMHYAAWLARRWDDPAFKAAFPWFNSQRYWEDHILSLKEQAARLNEPPLQWM
ncbi:MAG: serine/threonine protein kinase [Mariprofundaceae bacterium]